MRMKSSNYCTPAQLGVGKLGSMYGELTSISSMGSDQDSNPGPSDHQTRTPTTTPSCYPNAVGALAGYLQQFQQYADACIRTFDPPNSNIH